MKLRRCRKCHRRKPVRYFNRRNLCKNCEQQCNRKQKNIIDHIHSIKENATCTICGENATCCLEFHHKDPKNKKFDISNIWKRTNSSKLIMEELNKCIILCSNCHKKLHNGIIQLKEKDEIIDCGVEGIE